ncbi:ATP-binding cassette domain-containing protein [Intestinimonas aquisgranensis]|uniref:ABC transporter ATP-binding protein n=1 Tax=Flavonifractor sp. An9 TaxID=1965664 RepID=UPI000B39E9BB|nr:ATP-binding cassette domain-containing protein [Flavonifractor sp. An9]MCC2257694.1 ATP-binding cassette domain-containing protein [Intestinimonas aquisgranensis]OUN09314.1 bacitracin ABC transporter ATP-binding protein [Flavonifractor sp. An9]
MNIIETHDLCKQYGNALRVAHLDLDVPEGSVYGFLGPNGAGKSTTLKMILGLVRPTAGDIRVLGKKMDGGNRLAVLRQVGSLIESPSYYGHLTGEENLRIVQTLRGVPEKNIREVLQIVRLDGQRGKRVAHYSLGMKQRLGLAAALLGYPKLLILDEPTNGLDPAGIQEMRELICSLPERFGMTVVVSSHLLSEIDQMADHVAIIREGELVFQDTLEALHGRSRHHLALRTTNNAVARAVLQEKSVPCQEEEGYLILPILSDEIAAQLTRLLGSRNLGVIRLEERQKSLEDIFLELTGKAASL